MRFEFVPLLRSSTGRLKSGAAQAGSVTTFIPNAGHLWIFDHLNEVLDQIVSNPSSKPL
jgi:hypothetical protein